MTKTELLKRATGRKPSSDPVADFKHRLRNAIIGCALIAALYGLGFVLNG